MPISSPKSRSDRSDKTKSRIGVGRFTFRNGDSYEGKYEVNIGERKLVRQGEGVYETDNFDVYEGKWNADKFANEDFHIRYNNNAQYKGHVAANGAMDGTGTYILPDGSSLTAVWSRNKPISDVIYKEPLGQEWTFESISESQVSFTTGNHFWKEIRETSSKENTQSFVGH